MRFGRMLPALFLVAVLATALLVLSGAGAAANGPDLSTAQGIDSYLLSIGVDPASAVRQNGQNNYAGSACPGKGWNCATGKVIVQTAAAGGSNRVEGCSISVIDELPGCVIVQVGPDNKAQCVQKGGPTQSCTITQTGSKNDAKIDQTIDQNSGSTQAAVQTAMLTQTSDGAFNHGTISQTINQSTSDGDAQTQDAHQSAVALQTATGSADNDLQGGQSQSQKAFGGTTQDQNATGSGAANCSSNIPSQPNACANIQQTSDAGNNTSHLRQALDQDANAGSGAAVSQQQGTFSGGLEGRVHQATTTGKQQNDANQDKRQHMSGPDGAIQTQYDPMYCCGVGSQVGGTGRESIDQASSQDATGPGAFQQSELVGQSLTPQGTCEVKQHARNNADATSRSESLSPCPFLLVVTACSSGGEEEEPGCTEFPAIVVPPDTCGITCVDGPLVFLTRKQG